MRFDYEQYEVQPFPGQQDPGIVFRPVLPLRIIGEKGKLPFWGLLDTGADMTVLPKSIADFVGVAISSSPGTASGASGEIELSFGKVLLEIGSGKELHRWYSTVAIAEESWTEVLLGHASFLQYFDVTFFGEKRAVRLKRNKLPFEAIQLPSH